MKKLFTLSFLFTTTIFLQAQQLTVTQVATGFSSPTDIKHCGDDRLFIVERPGYIRIIDSTGATLPTPFLNIQTLVLSGTSWSERGLLGMAFDPNYSVNGYFYVNYTSQPSGHTHVSRFSVDPTNPDSALPSSEEVLMEIHQPYANHNGGHLAFGHDGYLYIGMGDGGSSGDPGNRAQNLDSLLGKMLRIDVSSAPGFTIPADNPFVGIAGRDEIWSYGLRNPWRFSFDRLTGDLWISDVGQGSREEIDFQEVSSTGGENYGWRCYEGDVNYNVGGSCPTYPNTAQPIHVYNHSGGNCSVTGGYIYRGAEYATLFGQYFFTDFCTPTIRSLKRDSTVIYTNYGSFAGSGYSTFGENRYGEIYMADLLGGQLYKLGDTLCLPVAHLSDLDTLHVCGSSVDLSTPAGKNFSYVWSANGSTVPGNGNTLHVIQSGTYSVAVTNPASCTNVTPDLYVLLDPVPTVSLSGLDTGYCSNFPVPDTLVGSPVGGVYSGNGMTGNVFDPAAAGQGTHRITYTFTTVDGCSDSSSQVTNVAICAGIPGIPGSDTRVFPNPFRNALTVKGTTRVEIYNVVGSKMMEQDCDVDGETLDTSRLSPGLYFVRLYAGEYSIVKKVVRE